jgi:tetratricopeptide (TPR) repeat protein
MQGEFAAAGYDYYRAIEDPKNAVVANIGLADVMKILGQSVNSVKYYEIAMNQSPDNADLRLKIARAYEDAGQYELASQHYNYALQNSDEKEDILNSLEKICRQRVEKNPSDADAHCNLGVIYQKRGFFDNALIEYDKAEKLNPSLIIPKVNISIINFEKKKYKESIEAANKALLIDPKNAQARLQKAKCYQALSMWENATEEYKNVLKYDKTNAEAQYGLADIYSKNMPEEDAVSTIKAQGIELSPEFYATVAYSAHKNKDIDKAIKFYKLAIEANPNDSALYLNLGQIYNGQEKYSEALALVESAKQKFPNDERVTQLYNSVKSRYSGSLFSAAANLAAKGSYAEAITKYAQISPQNYDSYVGIASAYQMQNDYSNALVYYKKALTEKPKDEAVLITISGIYVQMDKLNDAETYLKQVPNQNQAKVKELQNYIDSQKSDVELKKAIAKYEAKEYKSAEIILSSMINQKLGGYMPYYYRAMTYDALGDFKKAVADYESVIAKDSSVAFAYYSLGVDYDSLGNFQRAVQNYKKFLELSKGSNDYINYARERIKQSI